MKYEYIILEKRNFQELDTNDTSQSMTSNNNV